MPTRVELRTNSEWLAQALRLAADGHGLASPNPLVGAVVVRAGEVVGQGFHTYDGIKHAEVLALEQAGAHARGATLYTNLEPCCHTGRTPPCVEAIQTAGVTRVVAAMADPNSRVSGRGFELLRAAGLEVEVGVHEEEARRLNEAFACYIRAGRPHVTVKAALTLDGKIANDTGNARWITSDESRAFVQTLRHQHDAILAGVGTVLADDPLLTDRSGRPRRRPLLRVVLDTRLRIPLESQLVRTAANDVLVFTSEDASPGKRRELEARAVQVECIRELDGKLAFGVILRRLAAREITSVLVEGGAQVYANALEASLVDKVFLFYAPKFLGDRSLPLLAPGRDWAEGPTTLLHYRLHRFGPDFAVEGYLRDVYGDH
ncbi:MAG: bifunctional diaminohydroxyphosphoribosylaminopyrimidine deaminase/5-amino-6-(5-phosphoribosylamino)uracil reductase RibD [Acidobacteria bacterium]|nr:bifunctional diaminohydroxyphosphoribosylaminopyrimidine deaminase/5-amino-6-(5-phosphoribosylamino)uracil reductase RibD [Acidobacteriota bacterium]